MSDISVRLPNGSTMTVAQYSIECPYCHTIIIPNYLCQDHDTIYASCPNESCRQHFILALDRYFKYTRVVPNVKPMSKIFSEIITSISPQFASIYNQAYHAEQMDLDQICGVGYRKALEFLIKDYLISKETDEQVIVNIKKKFLGNCIAEYVAMQEKG